MISAHLENKQAELDYVQDILRIAYDMYYENDNPISHFYHKLSGRSVIAGYGQIADRIMWLYHEENSVHPSVKGMISLSPSLMRDAFLLDAARLIQVDGILLIAGSTDAMRPISNVRPIFTQIPRGPKHMNGVCKIYVELQGGNHCYFTDYHPGKLSRCYKVELEYPTFKITSMTHEYQLNVYNTKMILEFMNFITNPSNETATTFQQFLINSRETTGDIQYLQSCYVDDILFAHDKYFPPDTEQKIYRTII